jgi:hypothetical protein
VGCRRVATRGAAAAKGSRGSRAEAQPQRRARPRHARRPNATLPKPAPPPSATRITAETDRHPGAPQPGGLAPLSAPPPSATRATAETDRHPRGAPARRPGPAARSTTACYPRQRRSRASGQTTVRPLPGTLGGSPRSAAPPRRPRHLPAPPQATAYPVGRGRPPRARRALGVARSTPPLRRRQPRTPADGGGLPRTDPLQHPATRPDGVRAPFRAWARPRPLRNPAAEHRGRAAARSAGPAAAAACGGAGPTR